jgi:hypothetical protein
MYPLFQTAKSRPVVGCWPIGESSAGTRVAVIEFARRLTHALASLVVIDGDRRICWPSTGEPLKEMPCRFTLPRTATSSKKSLPSLGTAYRCNLIVLAGHRN